MQIFHKSLLLPKVSFYYNKRDGSVLTTLSPWCHFGEELEKNSNKVVEPGNIQLWHFLNKNICFMIENDISFISFRQFRLKKDSEMVKSCTGNKIFHLIWSKIWRLGCRVGDSQDENEIDFLEKHYVFCLLILFWSRISKGNSQILIGKKTISCLDPIYIYMRYFKDCR